MTTLYLMCGLPGAGKTTLAKDLETSQQALRLCPDEWIYPLLKTVEDAEELDRLRSPVEGLLWDLAKRVLTLGVSAVLENGFWAKDERLDFMAQARALGVRTELYVCDPPLDVLWQRLDKRNQNLKPGTFHVAKEQLELWATWFQRPEEDELSQYDAWRRITT